MYVPVKTKFSITLVIALAWLGLSVWLSLPWVADLAAIVSLPLALCIILAIAWIPGFMNAFLLSAYLIDKRPPVKPLAIEPDVSVLIAAFNEEAVIEQTLLSLQNQEYRGKIEIIFIDDGSTDATLSILTALNFPELIVLQNPHQGKAKALNTGLAKSTHDLIITLDADTYLRTDAIRNLVGRLYSDPADTMAVAGSIYAKNTRANWLTRMQTWDYFHAIAAIKRMQSLFQGTLVAQGALSIYRKKGLLELGGWTDCVGEDIVLTWGLLQKGYRVGFAESALAFTNVPTTYKQFFSQRSRWARGMMEAFKKHPGVLTSSKFYTLLIYWNLCFPLIDLCYFLVFLPGLIAACFGYYLIAGPLTVAILPLAILQNIFFFKKQKKTFSQEGVVVRKDIFGFILYVMLYQILMVPACLHGYFSEILNKRKSW